MTAALSALGFAVAFIAAWWLANRFSRPGSSFYLADDPNERSLHTEQTSRSGGIALLLGLMAGLMVQLGAFSAPLPLWPAIAGAFAVATVSLLDDRHNVPAGVRLIVHFIAAALAVSAGALVSGIHLAGAVLPFPSLLALVFSGLLIVWFVNLYNFMDGMDGFAGGMSVIGFGALAVLGAISGAIEFALLAGTIAAASAGFLIVNWPPARIFMGDTGASVLGFIACVMCLWADRTGVFSLWVGLLVFSPFFVDATVTLTRRALKGEAVWRAHRKHCYQRLVRSGWSHRKTTLSEYVVMVLAAVSAVIAQFAETDGNTVLAWALAGGWLLAYTVLIALVRRVEVNAKR